MKYARTAMTVWLSLTAWLLYSQTISPSVISTAGGLGVSDAGTLSYTVGEMAMIETYATTSHFLTQGFQQPWDLITAVDDEFAGIGITAYPNPTSENIFIRVEATALHSLQMRLADVTGRIVMQQPFSMTGMTTIHSLRTDQLPAGIYLLSITSSPGETNPAKPVTTKIHIAH